MGMGAFDKYKFRIRALSVSTEEGVKASFSVLAKKEYAEVTVLLHSCFIRTNIGRSSHSKPSNSIPITIRGSHLHKFIIGFPYSRGMQVGEGSIFVINLSELTENIALGITYVFSIDKGWALSTIQELPKDQKFPRHIYTNKQDSIETEKDTISKPKKHTTKLYDPDAFILNDQTNNNSNSPEVEDLLNALGLFEEEWFPLAYRGDTICSLEDKKYTVDKFIRKGPDSECYLVLFEKKIYYCELFYRDGAEPRKYISNRCQNGESDEQRSLIIDYIENELFWGYITDSPVADIQ